MRPKLTRKRLKVRLLPILLVWVVGLCVGCAGNVGTAPSPVPDVMNSSSPRKSCARGRPSEERFPFLGLQALTGSRQVTIMGDEKAREQLDKSLFEKAIEKWLKACSQELHIPTLVIDWDHDRPPFDDKVYRTTLFVSFVPDEEPYPDPQQGKPRVAEWLSFDNSIRIFGKCGHRKMSMPCEEIRDSIKWKSEWGYMVLAHEIGHALGLDHDYEKCEEHGLMKASADKDIILPVIQDYCRLGDAINNDKAPCNNDGYKVERESHPCEDVNTDSSVVGRP